MNYDIGDFIIVNGYYEKFDLMYNRRIRWRFNLPLRQFEQKEELIA